MNSFFRFLIFFLTAQNFAQPIFASEWDNKGFFRENTGQIVDQYQQTNNRVLFLLEQASMKVYLTTEGFSYEIYKCIDCTDKKNSVGSKCELNDNKFQFSSHRVDIAFLNSNKDFLVEKSGELVSKDRYYNQSSLDKSFILAKRYEKVIYKNIYKGVDICFYTNDKGEFKYDMLLDDGADLSQIVYSFNGSEVRSDEKGGITIVTPMGNINETIPLSYLIDGNVKRKNVDIIFKVGEENTVSFLSKENIEGRQLVVDPFPALQWATYYGDSNIDMVNSVTSDSQGNIIAVGQTMSSSNIATSGSHQVSYAADYDLFVVKFNKDGIRQWATYYGGNATDRGNAICTDDAGNIYLGGSTYSSNNIVTVGAWQPFLEGPDDGFIVKFNSSGVRQWGTYYGGNQHDFIADIIIDNYGDIVLTGHTRSNYNISTTGSHQPNLSGLENTMISKFSSSGSLIWGTYLGAGGYDDGYGIEIDSGNNIYVAGHTESTSGIATNGTFMPSFQGLVDGFIVKFNSNGSRIWGTYFGGSGMDRIWDIALDSNNNIFVVGETEGYDTIATPGAFQTSKGSFDDSFLQKFNSNGERLWGTFIGGNSSDYLYNIKCMKSSGDLVIGGYTESDNNIATSAAFQAQRGGAFDAFVMKFSNNGNLFWGTYFGGNNTEEMKSLTLGDNNNIIIAGYTASINGIATQGSYQTNYGGHSFDGFIAKLCEPLIPVISYTDSICVGNSLVLDPGNGFNSFLWNDSTTAQQHVSNPGAGVYDFWVTTIDTNNCAGLSDTISVTVFPAMATPVINQNGSILSSSQGAAYQWYLNGNIIPGATGQDYTMLQGGSYVVLVTDGNGCAQTSDPFLITGLVNSSFQEISIFPNPASKELQMFFNNENTGSSSLCTVFNTVGQSLFQVSLPNNTNKLLIPVDEFSNGMYFLVISGGDNSATYKFIVLH